MGDTWLPIPSQGKPTVTSSGKGIFKPINDKLSVEDHQELQEGMLKCLLKNRKTAEVDEQPFQHFLSSIMKESNVSNAFPNPKKHKKPKKDVIVWMRESEHAYDFEHSTIKNNFPVICNHNGGQLMFIDNVFRGVKESFLVKVIPNSANSKIVDLQNGRNAERFAEGRSELAVLKNLSHPFICKLLYYFEDSQNLFFFYPLYPCGLFSTLLTKLTTVTMDVAAYYTGCVISAVDYLHRNLVIHRDISTKSIVLAEHRRPVLFNFDYAMHYSGKVDNSEVILMPENPTRAPEMFSQDWLGRSNPDYYSTDVWGIGVFLGELVLGAETMSDALRTRLEGYWSFSITHQKYQYEDVSCPGDVLLFLNKCLKRHPNHRPTLVSLIKDDTLFYKYGVPNIENVVFQEPPQVIMGDFDNYF